MPLYRGFFKKGPTIPEPVEPTRRIARAEPAEKARPTPPPPGPVAPPQRSVQTEPAEQARPTPPAINAPLNAPSGPVVG